jgi:hypothetical protein
VEGVDGVRPNPGHGQRVISADHNHSYAHYYKVKSAFCYDSRHLLILHWKKQVRGGKPEVLVIPVEKEDPSVREAMYHLLCKCLPENFDEPGSGD